MHLIIMYVHVRTYTYQYETGSILKLYVCTLPKCKFPDEMFICSVAVFRYHPVQFSALEEDADVDDDPRPGEDEDEVVEEESELQKLSRKPWGVSKHYCPVALKDMEVLWPGNADHALKYRDRLYYFYSEEAKEAFELNVEKYASFEDSLKVRMMYIVQNYTYIHW